MPRKNSQPVLSQLIEVRRLMRQHDVSLRETLALLLDELHVYEQVERWEVQQRDRELPLWVYEQS